MTQDKGNPKSQALVKTFSAFDEDPDLSDIIEHVSNGGSLFQYCQHNEIPFGATRRWIYKDENRKLAYEDALAAHEDWANQALAHMILNLLKFDPASVHDDTGRLLPMNEWPAEARAALTKVKTCEKTGALKEAHFAGKLDAIKMLGSSTAFSTRKPKSETKSKSLEDILMEIEDEEKADEE